MSKKLSFTVAVIIIAALFFAPSVYAFDDISVSVDGRHVIFYGQQPVMRDGRILVPVRGVFEELGFSVGWDGAVQRVTLTGSTHTVVMTIGSAVFTTNGRSYVLEVPAQLIGGTTMLPLRAVLESVGYTLDWDASTRTVLISSPFARVVNASPGILEIPFGNEADYGSSIFVAFTNVSVAPTYDDFMVTGIPDGLVYTLSEISPSGANITLTGTLTSASQYKVNISVHEMAGSASFTINALITVGGQFFCTSLTTLEMNEMGLTDEDIVHLRYMTNLTDLSLNGNYIRNTGVFAPLVDLQRLSIANNFIRDWSYVEHVPNLIRGQQRLSSITLPNRRLTNAERREWIEDYIFLGGPTELETEFIELINEVRRNHNLSQLTVDNTLMMAARFHSQTMSNLQTGLSHNAGPYATNPAASHGASATMARAFGANLRWNGGNGSMGRNTAQGLIDGWMNSDGHRRFILSPEHRFVGIGHYGGFSYLFLSDRASN